MNNYTTNDDLRADLISSEQGMGDSLVKHAPRSQFSKARLVKDKLDDFPCILDYTTDSVNDDTMRFKRVLQEGHKVVKLPQRSIAGALRVGELDITSPLVIEGQGVTSINSLSSTIIKIADASYGIQFLGNKDNRPHGGGLRYIDIRGETDNSTGILLRVESWSYFWCEMLALQNLAGWGLSLRNVAEGGINTYLCRRLGSDTTGCIQFEDYLDNKNNNVNNFSLTRGTLGFNSGNWIYGTDYSNLDAIWIDKNKFEYDDKPASGNISSKHVIYLGQANRVSIDHNVFTNYKLTNTNIYSHCIKIGENSRVQPTITKNKFHGCDNVLIEIAGGSVGGSENESNRGNATTDGTFICTSNLPQDIQPLIFHSNNGVKNKRSHFDVPGFISSHQMIGTVNNPFVPDSKSMTHYLTVMSVPASTEIRRGTISSALISEKDFVHISARLKNVSDITSDVILTLDGVNYGPVSVSADGIWKNYKWQIRPDKISSGAFILTNGSAPVLFDGVFIERKEYFDWSFAWNPGAIAAGQSATSPVQSVKDTIGFLPWVVKATANGSTSGTELQESVDVLGNVTIICRNNTTTTITPSFSRIRLRYES